jgi:integrase
MARPKTYRFRTKVVSGARVAFYARFTDQHGVRQEPLLGYDLQPVQVERKLREIQTDVERGTWRTPGAVAKAPEENPTFHSFASDWRADFGTGEHAPRTLEFVDWALKHLLRYFAHTRMRSIDYHAVDSYRRYVAKQKTLSAKSLNRTIEVLARICEGGVEAGYFEANPAAGKRRKAAVKKGDPVGNWLDYDAVVALLDAAKLLDTVPYAELVERYGEGVPYARFLGLGRPAQLASLYLCGLRVSESCGLKRRHINWDRGTLQIEDAKTPDGYRLAPMHRLVFDEMRAWWERYPSRDPHAPLFPHSRGGHRDKDNTRKNVLKPAVQLAELLLVERGQNPLPPVARTHDGRRTAANWWAEAGYETREVMGWIGHANAKLTLEVYRRARNRAADPRVKAAMAEVPADERGRLRVIRAA